MLTWRQLWVVAVLVAVAVPAVAALRYVPPPQPVRGKYEVGVYYFPGWQGPSSWQPLAAFPERKPLLGWYREGDPEVADWQLKWAAEHGITFFIYDWYWVKGATSLMHGLDAYSASRYHRYVKFCLLWANHNPPGTSSEQDLLNVTRYWLANYFHRREYFTIGGKPVVIIFSPGRLTEDMGTPAVQAAFARMRALCVADGLPGLYLLACAGPDAESLAVLAQQGYDGATGYNYPLAGLPGWGSGPYESMVTGYETIWRQFLEIGKLPYLLPLSPGWDSRPWHGDKAVVRYGSTPARFADMCRRAKAMLDAGTPGLVPGMAIVEAWNEWGEGSYIEPHRQFGFGYLDALREVFAGGGKHQDLVPEQVGRGPYEVAGLKPGKPEWEFARDREGWTAGMELTDLAVRDGSLAATSLGNDPILTAPPVRVDTRQRHWLRVRMRTDGGRTGQLFWAGVGSGLSEEASVRWELETDGEFHEYSLDLQGHPQWRGVVRTLRLDPVDRPAHLALDYVRLTP